VTEERDTRPNIEGKSRGEKEGETEERNRVETERKVIR
jgi:hypothetical protein